MIFRFFLLFVGFGLSVIGGISIIAYLNLVTAGYSFIDYLKFIVIRVEFHLFIIGFIMIAVSIYIPISRKE